MFVPFFTLYACLQCFKLFSCSCVPLCGSITVGNVAEHFVIAVQLSYPHTQKWDLKWKSECVKNAMIRSVQMS